MRYRDYVKKRQKLIADAFLAKPTFSEHLMDINRELFELQTNKTISSKITESSRTWEKIDFNYDQETLRKQSAAHYESIITGKMTNIVRKVQGQVLDKCNQKDFEEE